jgi:hypothetical protein
MKVKTLEYSQSPRKIKARKPITIVAMPSIMKIHRQPLAYLPSPTEMSDKAYAN